MSASSLPSLSGRIAVVTGASRGIGRAVALDLARAGAHVVAVARTEGALVELDDEIRALGRADGATLVPMDVAQGEAVDRLGAAIHERWGRLDVLVGNAGVLAPLSPLGHVRPQDFERALAVNLTANWRLIRSLDPLLRRSDAGRAVFVTSGAARGARAYWGPSAVTKAGLEALARTYAAETVETAVRVNLVEPGPIRTRMRAMAMPGEDPLTVDPPEALSPHIVRLCAPETSETGRVWSYPERRFLD
jgi:NAD(P)-dependent dehydrogenase (short-subunit alcohol dehydrogenase family)